MKQKHPAEEPDWLWLYWSVLGFWLGIALGALLWSIFG